MRGRSLTPAVFTPVNDATFTLVSDEATFTPVNEENLTAEELAELAGDSDEDRFLQGEVHYVSSSNVSWFQWLGFYPDGMVQNQLYAGFLDGSVYEYDGVNMSEALLFFRTSSPGGMVWDHLRVRGTVFGYQKPYRLVSGNRVWKMSDASIARHEAVPPSGETFLGWHPLTNFAGGAGKMGQANINLNKRSGSKKIAYFTPPAAAVHAIPRPLT